MSREDCVPTQLFANPSAQRVVQPRSRLGDLAGLGNLTASEKRASDRRWRNLYRRLHGLKRPAGRPRVLSGEDAARLLARIIIDVRDRNQSVSAACREAARDMRFGSRRLSPKQVRRHVDDLTARLLRLAPGLVAAILSRLQPTPHRPSSIFRLLKIFAKQRHR
jgi:hypothetical protein